MKITAKYTCYSTGPANEERGKMEGNLENHPAITPLNRYRRGLMGVSRTWVSKMCVSRMCVSIGVSTVVVSCHHRLHFYPVHLHFYPVRLIGLDLVRLIHLGLLLCSDSARPIPAAVQLSLLASACPVLPARPNLASGVVVVSACDGVGKGAPRS